MNISAVYISHQYELKHHLSRIVDCPEIAAELVQESFIILSREAKKQVIQHPRGFLFKIARNLAYDYIKHRKVTENYQNSEDPTLQASDEAPSTERTIAANERLAIVKQIVDQLPPRAREVFILNRVYGMTYAEIAGKLEISDSAVEKHLAKALLHCKKQFKMRHADLADD